jgi:hypothetical protein
MFYQQTILTATRAISVLNAKSRLLSLPPELRLRIFEYVFGVARHHVMIKGDGKKRHVQLATCWVPDDPQHAYRKKTLEESQSSPQNQNDVPNLDPDHRRHLNCYRQYAIENNIRKPVKGHKRRLPLNLLLTCKAINQDAALIMWHDHVFELDLFSDDLEKFVNRMTPAQRNALRTIAFDVRATDMGQTMSRRSRAMPAEGQSLLTWRLPMRDSFLALTKLQRVELFVDIWPGIEAAAPYAFQRYSDGRLMRTKFHMIGDWIRLLERRGLEDVVVRVEEGALVQPGLHPLRNKPFPISAQQRLEWEEQIRSIVRGKLGTGELSVDSGAEYREESVNGPG